VSVVRIFRTNRALSVQRREEEGSVKRRTQPGFQLREIAINDLRERDRSTW